MEAALFYTFSTIAQALAAAITILGAFALYRLQAMNAEISERSQTVAQAATGAERHQLRELHVHGKFDEMLSAAENIDHSKTVEYNYQVTAARIRLGALLSQRRSLRRYLSVAFWVSTGLLTGSLIILADAPTIAAIPHGAALAEAVGIVWFVASLGVCARLIWSALA